MPTYEYACPTCGNFERDQRITDPALKACPTCGSADVKRLISRSSFALKGGGWYSDGYGSGGKPDKRESKSDGGGCGQAACGAGACAGSGSALN
jgi:putative FmdB family regulatory protein